MLLKWDAGMLGWLNSGMDDLDDLEGWMIGGCRQGGLGREKSGFFVHITGGIRKI
jgi:hypothetical protein